MKPKLDKIIYGYLIDMQKNGISAEFTVERLVQLFVLSRAWYESETVDGHKKRRGK